MKEKMNAFLNKLMDFIVPSLILAVGMVTVIGFFYSLVLAFRYVKDGFKDFQFFNKQHLGYSILLELFFILFIAVTILNFYLFPSYSPTVQVLVFSALLFFGVVLLGMTLSALWLLSKTSESTWKVFLSESLSLFYLSIPYWLAYLFLWLLTTALSIMYPALLIFTLGLNIRVIDKLLYQTSKKFNLT